MVGGFLEGCSMKWDSMLVLHHCMHTVVGRIGGTGRRMALDTVVTRPYFICPSVGTGNSNLLCPLQPLLRKRSCSINICPYLQVPAQPALAAARPRPSHPAPVPLHAALLPAPAHGRPARARRTAPARPAGAVVDAVLLPRESRAHAHPRGGRCWCRHDV